MAFVCVKSTHGFVTLEVTESGHRESPSVGPLLPTENTSQDLEAPLPGAWTDDPVESVDLHDYVHYHGYFHNQVVRTHARPGVPVI